MEKKNLRKEMMTLRKNLTFENCEKKSHQITELLFQSNEYQIASHILIYMNYGKEVITTYIIEHALKNHKKVFIPKVDGQNMDFYEITGFQDCTPGFRGILEPKNSCKLYNTFHKNDLMILPGLAFSEKGDRLGYGGGFYDRYLSKINYKINCAALSYDFQIVDFIPTDQYDKKINIIFTETKTIRR